MQECPPACERVLVRRLHCCPQDGGGSGGGGFLDQSSALSCVLALLPFLRPRCAAKLGREVLPLSVVL